MGKVNTEYSRILDENGEPLVTYHGTQKGGFSVFDPAESVEPRGKNGPLFNINTASDMQKKGVGGHAK